MDFSTNDIIEIKERLIKIETQNGYIEEMVKEIKEKQNSSAGDLYEHCNDCTAMQHSKRVDEKLNDYIADKEKDSSKLWLVLGVTSAFGLSLVGLLLQVFKVI